MQIADSRKFKKVPLTPFERKVVDKVLEALGEVRVTRAMTNVCKPNYANHGWDNCFLVQAFGGKANFNRMVEAQGWGDTSAAVAEKLDLEQDVIHSFTYLFDENGVSSREVRDGNGYFVGEYETYRASHGKVASLLTHIDRWLARRGIDLSNLTWAPAVPVDID